MTGASQAILPFVLRTLQRRVRRCPHRKRWKRSAQDLEDSNLQWRNPSWTLLVFQDPASLLGRGLFPKRSSQGLRTRCHHISWQRRWRSAVSFPRAPFALLIGIGFWYFHHLEPGQSPASYVPGKRIWMKSGEPASKILPFKTKPNVLILSSLIIEFSVSHYQIPICGSSKGPSASQWLKVEL